MSVPPFPLLLAAGLALLACPPARAEPGAAPGRKAARPRGAGAPRAWAASSRKAVRTLEWDDQATPALLAYTPDGKTLFTDGGGGVRVWDVKTGTELLHYRLGGGGVRALAVAPEGRLVAVA